MVVGTQMTKILVVDDDARMTRLLTMTLPSEFEVVQASDGQEGLEMAETHTPDLILMDVNMPGVNGFQMLQQVRQSAKLAKTKVILVTGRDSDEDQRLGIRLGADAYFTKPFSPLSLLEKINDLLGVD